MRSPYAAGRAKAIGKSGETTPGSKKAKLMNRKPCKTSIGCRARARGRLRSAGQKYRAVTIPQAVKLRAILTPYNARWGIMDFFPEVLPVAAIAWLNPRTELADGFDAQQK